MVTVTPNSSKDDMLHFADEKHKKPTMPGTSPKKFKLLIVDDEKEVHAMTRLVLNDYQHQGRGIEFISAFSGADAKKVITQQPDIACCLLDVVMESKEAGLEVARFIREDAGNDKMRIILRTGQPGQAPEKEIILNYDINDYKEKTELTSQKLFTTITTALRSYLHLVELDDKNREIQSKNIRLNEEIARRIVAESNLTKYNRSLERMIESKTQRLEKALKTLEITEKQLVMTRRGSILPEVSSVSLTAIQDSGNRMTANLKKMDSFRQQLTCLLEKYNTLETILLTHKGDKNRDLARISDIQSFKTEINLEDILKRYPQIIDDSKDGIRCISKAVSDIKLFIGINDEQPTAIDINHLIRTLVGEFNVSHPKIDIQTELTNIPVPKLPEQNFIQAVRAVMENALNAVAERGIVSVATAYEDQQITIRISDIGIGISPDLLSRIFVPYFKGWKKGGPGLGLSFAKSVLVGCGGDVEVTSTLNEGSTFTLTLPHAP